MKSAVAVSTILVAALARVSKQLDRSPHRVCYAARNDNANNYILPIGRAHYTKILLSY